MDLGLKGRSAFVAGASSGLGLATAKALAREGCRVAICSRDEARLKEAAAAVRESAGQEADVLTVVCDVTDEDQIRAAIEKTVETFGGLNILITNAGGPPAGLVEDFDAADWHKALDLNLMSTINMCRHALPHLKAAAEGPNGLARVLMFSSISARQPIPHLYLSNVSRAGVQGFARSLAEEVGKDGITVNTILPGYTRTERHSRLVAATQERTGRPAEEIESEWASDSAMKRIAEPEEFAAAAVFLVSGPASYLTGVALAVDGGTIKSIF